MIIKMIFKTFRLCLLWALLGAGGMAVYKFAAPKLKSTSPAISKSIEKIQPSITKFKNSLSTNKMLKSVKEKLKTLKSTPVEKLTKSKSAKLAKQSDTEHHTGQSSQNSTNSNDIFSRQLSIVNDLMK
jgi:hypothetical protein